ncbi:MAG TPA: divalent-cation tolerance protein CutA [Pirellulales bacterium]|jgi:periplasmic divalent cation tolerance protein
MAEYLQIVTTTASQEDARGIAAALIERRQAACAQVIGPIESTYRWQGKIETAQEWQCVIKTRGALYPVVEATIRELHAYEAPEIIATAVEAGSEAYLLWIDEQVSPPPGDVRK